MKLSKHIRETILLAYPVSLGQLGHITVSLADTAMVGVLGSLPLAGAALGNSIFHLPLLFIIGVTYGMTPLVAAAYKENNHQIIGQYYKQALIQNLIIASLLLGLIFIISFFLPYLGQDVEVIAITRPYLAIIAFSIFPVIIFQTGRQIAEGLSLTKPAMYISILGNGLNIILNYAFIYGVWGFPQWGLFGAGLSTFIARVIMALAMTFYIFNNKKISPILKKGLSGSWKHVLSKKLLKMGIPVGLQYVFEVGAFTTAAFLAGTVGEKPLGAHQIVLILSGVTYLTATGIATAASIRIGGFFGEKNFEEIKKSGYAALLTTAVLMAIFAFCFVIFRKTLPPLFVHDTEIWHIAEGLMIIAALYQLSDGLQAAGLGILRGIGDVSIPMWVTALAYWIIAIPISYFLGIKAQWGATGIWWGLLIGLTFAAVMHISRFYKLINEKTNDTLM